MPLGLALPAAGRACTCFDQSRMPALLMRRVTTRALCILISLLVLQAYAQDGQKAVNDGREFLDCQENVVASLLTRHPHMTIVRPSSGSNADSPVEVIVWLDFVGIVDVNEKGGYLTTALFPRIQWQDPRLVWNSTVCGGLQEVEVPASSIWIPDIEIYNSFKESMLDNAMHSVVTVHSNGTAVFVPRRHVRTPCHFDMLKFPYDSHSCDIALGSWTYNVSKVTLKTASDPKNGDIHVVKYAKANDWDTFGIEIFGARVEYSSDSSAWEFDTVYSKLALKRRPNYFYRLYVAPAAVMIFTMPLIHFIPTGTSEKLTLCGSMLVSCVIMFKMLEDLFPAYSIGQVPVLLHYYSSALLLLFLSMYAACTTAIIGYPGTKGSRLPSLLKKFFLDKLGYMCCVTTRVNRFEKDLVYLEKHLKDSFAMYAGDDGGDRQMSHLQQRPSLDDDEETAAGGSRTAMRGGGTSSTGTEDARRAIPREQLIKVLQTLVSEMQHLRFMEGCRLEWQQFATLLDRLAGILFLVLAVLVTVAIVDISLPM